MKNVGKIDLIGVDLSKHYFEIHAIDRNGREVMHTTLTRKKFSEFLANTPKCVIAMETCGGAHYWGRKAKEFGHEVRLMASKFVKPYTTGNRSDAIDAAAIAEAASRPRTRYVAVKSEAQQEMGMIHTTRELLVKQRTSTRNSVRGMLAEYGLVFAKGWSALRKGILEFLSEDSSRLSILKDLIAMRYNDLQHMEKEIAACELKIHLFCQNNEQCKSLLQIRGIGPITATALVAHIGDPGVFKNGRHLAAYLGLVPKHVGTGGKITQLGISKRGDRYLRKLLVHGARSVATRVDNKNNKLNRWLGRLIEKRGFNKATVALANKNARLCWAVLKYGKLLQ